jgi:hypothetical protein
VTDLFLTYNVPAPVTDGTPVTSFAGNQYNGIVNWSAGGLPHVGTEKFKPDTAYTAAVTMWAAFGWTFEGVAANSFGHGTVGAVLSNPAGLGEVTIVFPATGTLPPITVDLTGYIAPPTANAVPTHSFFAGNFGGVVAWKDEGNAPVTGIFPGNPTFSSKTYTATVTLTALPGYTFSGATAFTHAGVSVITHQVNDGTLVVTVSFAAVTLPPFSDVDTTTDTSAIDLIRKAKIDNKASVSIQLDNNWGPVTETVSFQDAGKDFGVDGLVLNSGNSPAAVVINGNGRTVDLTGAANGEPLITVGAGVTLTLKNITLKGLNSGDDSGNNNNASIVLITDGGHLILESGTFITGNYCTGSYNGGGVTMTCTTSASFTMNGGEISGNTTTHYYGGGGGVNIDAGNSEWSFFTINGGTISGNTAVHGGGVVLYDQVHFIMNDGIISGNTAIQGGGVQLVRYSDFVMNGGEISGNTGNTYGGGGVFIEFAAFTMNAGKISGNTAIAGIADEGGGGVNIWKGKMNMTGGEISGNTAGGSGRGGGVFVYKGDGPFSDTFTMTGGTISGNTAANYGGGVFVYANGTFAKTGNSIIYGDTDTTHNAGDAENTAASGIGHAVYVNSGPKKRNTTAGTGVSLNSATAGTPGGWE